MAISFVNSAVGSASPNTNTVITLPGSMSANDLILLIGAVGDTADNGLAAPTEGGYTDVLGASDLYANDTNDVNLDLFYKFHNGSDTTATFAAVGGTNASNVGVMLVFRGVALVADGGPFDTAPTTATGINGVTIDPPSHNWSGASGVWTVVAAALGYNGVGASPTWPANYSANAVNRIHNDSVDCWAGMSYRTSPDDPEDPGTFSFTGTGTTADNAWAAITMSLKEAPPAVDAPFPFVGGGYYPEQG